MRVFCCHVNNIRENPAHTPRAADSASARLPEYRSGLSRRGHKRSYRCAHPRDGPKYSVVFDVELRDYERRSEMREQADLHHRQG
jgi:hypothetical protein